VFAVDLQSNDNNLLDKCRLRMMDEEAASTGCWVIMDYAPFVVARKQGGSGNFLVLRQREKEKRERRGRKREEKKKKERGKKRTIAVAETQ